VTHLRYDDFHGFPSSVVLTLALIAV